MPSPLRTHSLTIQRRLTAAIISAVAIAGLTHIATVLLFFVANGATAENLSPISTFFLPSSLVLLVLAFGSELLGGALVSGPTIDRDLRWFLALVAGILIGVLAAIGGTAYALVAAGGNLITDGPLFIFGSLIGTNLIFIIAAAVAAASVGLWAWRKVAEAPRRAIALVRKPSARLEDGELTHLERVEVDSDLAEEQWAGYVLALQDAGFETVEVPAADELPDSVFIEDAVVVFGGTAVITNPGAESRRPETDALPPILSKLGLAIHSIELPGTLDGGDVLKVGSTVYVGRGGRTNADGIAQLREIVAPLGYTVVAVPVTKVLHLKSAVTALPDGTVVGYLKHVDAPHLFERFLALPEPGAAVVVLAEDLVLMASSVPKSIEVVEDLGYTVIPVEVTEFEKLEGCVTCLSVRIR